jgi:hypothetical protein
VGAGIGVAGTILATFGTSWFNLRQTKLQLAAQQTEAERQRRFDSVKDRREPRERAFTEFLAAAQDGMDAVARNIADAKRDGTRVQMVPRSVSVNRQAAAVSMIGPTEVSKKSDAYLMTLVSMFGTEYIPGPGGTEAVVMSNFVRLNERLHAFTDVARAALENHGAEPSGQR